IEAPPGGVLRKDHEAGLTGFERLEARIRPEGEGADTPRGGQEPRDPRLVGRSDGAPESARIDAHLAAERPREAAPPARRVDAFATGMDPDAAAGELPAEVRGEAL